jgi:hypothetical protein
MRIAPAFEPVRPHPAVIVLRIAAEIDHAIDGRRTADDAVARIDEPPVVEMRLRLTPIAPVVRLRIERLGQCRRHPEHPEAPVHGAGLDDEDAD